MNDLEAIAILPHIWIIPVAALALFAFTVWTRRRATAAAEEETKQRIERYKNINVDASKWHETGWGMSTVMLRALAGAVAATAILCASIPFGPRYWSIYTVTGTVQDVTRTLEDGSGELTSVPVVTLDTLNEPIVVNQARIYSYLGQEVRFTCTVSWVPFGQDYYTCVIAGVESR